MTAAAAPHSAAIVTRNWRQEAPFMLAVFAAALALYAYTAPRTVALGDDALFIGTLHFFGVAHPPGYPLHTLLGGIFYHLLPFGTPAFKAHLFSGVAAAAACAAVYAATALLVTGRGAALLAACAYMVSGALWSQAIIAEVYTLNALLFFTLLALALQYAAHPSRKTLRRAAIVCGLGLANHYPLFILAAASIVVYALAYAAHKWRTLLYAAAIALGTAAALYLWMVWRSYDTSMPAHFYGAPLDSAEKFFHYLLRSGYAAGDSEAGVTWDDKFAALGFFAAEALEQYTIVGALFAATGAAALLRQNRRPALALLASLFMVSVLLVFLRDFKADYVSLTFFRDYHLTSYGIMAIFLAAGIASDAARIGQRAPLQGAMVAAATVLIAGATAAIHWPENNRRHYSWAEDFAHTRLSSVSANAVLFTDSDLDFPLGYLHYIKKERPDITMLNAQGLIYGSAPYASLPPMLAAAGSAADRQQLLGYFLHGTRRPVFFPPYLDALFASDHRRADMLGFYRRLSYDSGGRIQLPAAARDWLQANVGGQARHTDRWTRIQHTIAVRALVKTALAVQFGGGALPSEWQQIIGEARRHDITIDMLIAAHDLQRGQPAPAEEKLQQCRHPAEQPGYEITNNAEKAAFHRHCAQLARHLEGKESAAAAQFLEAARRFAESP